MHRWSSVRAWIKSFGEYIAVKLQATQNFRDVSEISDRWLCWRTESQNDAGMNAAWTKTLLMRGCGGRGQPTFLNQCHAWRWMASVTRPTATPFNVKRGNLTNQRLQQATNNRWHHPTKSSWPTQSRAKSYQPETGPAIFATWWDMAKSQWRECEKFESGNNSHVGLACTGAGIPRIRTQWERSEKFPNLGFDHHRRI